MKRDQFQGWIENPQHWNKYAYALNNPRKFIDPSGMTETIYYFLDENLTSEQKKFFAEHKEEIFDAIRDKLRASGIKDVLIKDGSTLNRTQIRPMLSKQPTGLSFLNFANNSYAGIAPPSDYFGFTINHMRSAVLMGHLQAGNPSDSKMVFRMSEVASHEIGHGMGFYSRMGTISYMMFWNHDLMNEGQDMPSKPRSFDMTIPENRQAVEKINKQSPQ